MILYYALGGGLGHLTRARAVLHTLGIREAVLLTASPFASDARVAGTFRTIQVPGTLDRDVLALRSYLMDIVLQLSPTEIFLDAFPGGLLGELRGVSFPSGVRVHHVARLLQWSAYQRHAKGPWPELHTTFVVEPLAPEHQADVVSASRHVQTLALVDPLCFGDPCTLGALSSSSTWLIVHAGSPLETAELCAYASELAYQEGVRPRLMLVSPDARVILPPGVTHLNCYPASPLFPVADRIVSACGFNIMRQTVTFADRHHFMPFSRRFDDQFLRAARRRQQDPSQP